MAYLVDQSKRVDTYQNPLMKRPELEPELAKRMYWWVSAALRKHIVENFDVDPTELDDTLEDTVKQAIGKAAADRDKAQTPMDLADRLAESDEITPRLLVQILRQGEVPLFEALFAKLTGLRLRLVRRMLFEPGGEALAIACKAVDIDKPTFASLFLLSRKAWSDEEVVNQGVQAVDAHDGGHPTLAQAFDTVADDLSRLHLLVVGYGVLEIQNQGVGPVLRCLVDPVATVAGNEEDRTIELHELPPLRPSLPGASGPVSPRPCPRRSPD